MSTIERSHEFESFQKTISGKLEVVGSSLRRHTLLEAAARILLTILALACLSRFSLYHFTTPCFTFAD